MRVDLDRLGGDLDAIAVRAPDLADGLAEFRAVVAELHALRRFEAALLAKQSHQPRPLYEQNPMLLCHVCAELHALYEARGEVVPAEQIRLVPSRAKRGHR